MMNYREKNRNYLVDKLPGKLKNIEEEMKINEAIIYCRDWIYHRKWL